MREEENITKKMEDQTSKHSTDLYFWIGLGLIGASLILRLANRRSYSGFVGRLGESVLAMGLYNKTIKKQQNDYSSSQWNPVAESTADMMSESL